LRYGPGARGLLDVYRPPNQGGKAPVIVFFYGGNWVSGDRKPITPTSAARWRRAASWSSCPIIACIRRCTIPTSSTITPRPSPGPNARSRATAAIRARCSLMGHSAGAYNAAMLALDGRWLGKQGIAPASLRGWIGLAGPYDFLPVQNRTARPVFDYPYTLAESQPINHVGKAAPPALLIAGTKDDSLVNPQRNTGGLAARLRAAGVPVREVYYDGVGHATLVASLSSHAARPGADAGCGRRLRAQRRRTQWRMPALSDARKRSSYIGSGPLSIWRTTPCSSKCTCIIEFHTPSSL
jgi:acetyl esterase/lipase